MLVEVRMQQRLSLHQIPVFPLLVTQMLLLLVSSVVLLFWYGPVTAKSGLCGGLIAWLPNLYFAHKAFCFSGARAAKDIVRAFYAGEAGKFIFTAILFGLTFAGVKPLEALAVFGVFLLTQMVGWLSPMLMKKRTSRP